MERILDLAAIWDRLPTFRVVAELEHLSRAAARLRVSPSAVSRSIKLLEREVGAPLFLRRPAGLALTPAGEALLDAARAAMRRVDESLAIAREQPLGTRLQIRACEPFASAHLWSVLGEMKKRHPRLEPDIVSGPDGNALGDRLSRGQVDVAIVRHVVDDTRVSSRVLERAQLVAVAPRNHPVHREPPRSLVELGKWPFVDVADHAWPAQIPRDLRVRVPDYDGIVPACVACGYLGLLPTVLSGRPEIRAVMTPLPTRVPHRLALHAITRRPIEVPTAADVFVAAALRRTLASRAD